MAGDVVIINTYDGRYWNIFIDKELFQQIHKDDYTSRILKKSFRVSLSNHVGISEDMLVFTLYDFYGELFDNNYDSNNFETFDYVEKTIKEHSLKPIYEKIDINTLESII